MAGSKTGQKRGSYKPRTAKPVIPNDSLDRIARRDTSIIPRLEVCQAEGQTAIVHIGHLNDDNGEKGARVWMMPISKGEHDHGLKFYTFTENENVSEPGFALIQWEEESIGFGLFQTESAKSRWSTQPQRKSEHLKWLLFVWEHLTGDALPTGKTNIKKRKRSEIKQEPGVPSTLPATPNSGGGRNRQSGNTLPPPPGGQVRTFTHAAYDVWHAWLTGDFAGIDNDNEVKRLQRAYTRLHGRGPKPSINVLRSAYKERLATKAPSSQRTQVWTQYRETRTGSTAVVILDQENYRDLAIRALHKTKAPSSVKAQLAGPPYQPRPDPLPTLDESTQILRDWDARGRSHWDPDIHMVRAARYVVENDIWQKVQARGSWY
jgi:hypothetical protein